MRTISEIALPATFGFCRKIYCRAAQGLAFGGDDENVGSPRNFLQKIFQNYFQANI